MLPKLSKTQIIILGSLALIAVSAALWALFGGGEKPPKDSEANSSPGPSADQSQDLPPELSIVESSEADVIRNSFSEVIFRYVVSLPEVSGGNPDAAEKINAYYKALREGTTAGEIARIKGLSEAESDSASFLAYSYSEDFEIELNDRHTLSIRRIIDAFEGGAHSHTSIFFDVFSLQTGDRLALSDLFNCDEAEYMPVIMGRVSEMTKADPNMAESFFAVEPDELTEVFNRQNFGLNGDSLIIFFQAYDIAPNASGIPEFHINLADISDILAPR